jgi:hypothetical protein
MPISQRHRDLFRRPGILDHLNLFQLLLDAKDLIPDLALALINIIRAELEQPPRQVPAAYRRYSTVTRSLCIQMPEVYDQVVDAWRQRRRN